MSDVKLFERLCRDSVAVNGCYLWQRYLGMSGDCQVGWNGRVQNVRRLALQLAGRSTERRSSPSCGNQRCWNPQHLGPMIIHRHTRTPAEVCEHVLSQVLQIGTCLWFPGHRARGGYRKINLGGKTVQVHRLVYEQLVGPIPDGLHIDHLCYNRACVNIEHLEPVTLAENNRRSHARRRALKESEQMITKELGL